MVNALTEHIARNPGLYTGLGSALALAWVATIPERRPRSLDDWWTWMRNWFQTANPATRNNIHTPNPTPPVDPARH